MVFEYELQTPRGGFLDITAQVSAAVAKFCEETGRTEASAGISSQRRKFGRAR